MYILFAISAFCFFALLLAAVAIARHVRSSREASGKQPHSQRDFAEHLFAAASDQNSRIPRPQPQQTVKQVLAKKSWNQQRPEVVTIRPDPEAQLAFDQKAIESVAGRMEPSRKPPQSAHQKEWRRLDWAYFNKDLGDLSDPYQTPRLRANSSDKTTSSERF
jgi:uncharacterized membrane protein YccC